MQSLRFSLLTGSLLLVFCLQVRPVLGHVDTLRAFPEKRFVNGGTAFTQYMVKNLRYPLEAMQTAVMGTELVSIIVTPAGKLASITIINSLGEAIDGEVMRLVRSTRKLWLPTDQSAPQDSIMLFLPVKFVLADPSGEQDFYVEAVKPDFILDETVVVGYHSRVSLDVRDDAYYVTKITEASQKQDYKQMLKGVNELIRRNPYSAKLYLQRASVEQKLGQQDEACRDYKKITNFLGNKHLPKQFTQNCP